MQENHSRVVSQDGRHGTIETIAPGGADEAPRAYIRLEYGQTILVPADVLIVQDDGSYYLPINLADTEQTYRQSGGMDETIVIPVVAEELAVEKRTIATGRVRLTKTVHEREEVLEEPLLQQEVDVERVNVNRMIDAPVDVRYEGETMIIPLMEEVLVVEKRLLLREEVHITRRQTETHKTQHVTLRSEGIEVERQELEG